MANGDIAVSELFDGEFEIVLKHWLDRKRGSYELQTPVVEDGVKWQTERQGSPGKLTFKVWKDYIADGLDFQEGDGVMLKFRTSHHHDWKVVFDGYVFTKKRNKERWIDVTAYDRLRYFKNKDTFTYTNQKASWVLKQMCDRLGLNCGTVDDTSYVIGNRAEDDQSVFDIIQNALDLTLISSGKMYALYADNNGINLRDINNLKTDVIIRDSSANDYDYESTIDSDVYNEINLYYDDDEKNERKWFIAPQEGKTPSQDHWGLLRLTESVDNPANAQDRANKMLTLYNRKKRTLNVKGAFGDIQCRAGASVIVQLQLGDINVNNWMLIESATHTFKKNEYRMDLKLSNGVFSS